MASLRKPFEADNLMALYKAVVQVSIFNIQNYVMDFVYIIYISASGTLSTTAGAILGI